MTVYAETKALWGLFRRLDVEFQGMPFPLKKWPASVNYDVLENGTVIAKEARVDAKTDSVQVLTTTKQMVPLTDPYCGGDPVPTEEETIYEQAEINEAKLAAVLPWYMKAVGVSRTLIWLADLPEGDLHVRD